MQSGDDDSALAESGLEASAQLPVCALDLKLRQLSVYASQRRLCITAALLHAFQEVEEGLLLLARPKKQSLAAGMAPAQKVLAAGVGFLRHSVCTGRDGKCDLASRLRGACIT